MTPNTRGILVQFTACIAAYSAVLVGSIALLRAFPESAWRLPLALSPMLPAFALVLVIVRAFRDMDELDRRIQLEALAFAFGATALVTFSYGFLEGIDFPRLSWIWVWPLMAALWVLGLLIARRRYA